MRWGVLLLAIGGCAASPLPEDSDAMTIVWERSYQMDRATEPMVSWHAECRADDWGAGRPRAVGEQSGCITMEMFYDTGVAELQTADKISESDFVLALQYWKLHLLGDDAPSSQEMSTAQRALTDAGM